MTVEQAHVIKRFLFIWYLTCYICAKLLALIITNFIKYFHNVGLGTGRISTFFTPCDPCTVLRLFRLASANRERRYLAAGN